jgi:hypothetical protein
MESEGSLPCPQQPCTVLYLDQMHPVHNFPPCFPKIHSNIILPSTPRSSEFSSLLLRFSNQNTVYISHLTHACYTPAHLIFLDLITLIIFSEASLCSLYPASCHFLPRRSEYSSQTLQFWLWLDNDLLNKKNCRSVIQNPQYLELKWRITGELRGKLTNKNLSRKSSCFVIEWAVIVFMVVTVVQKFVHPLLEHKLNSQFWGPNGRAV